MVDSDFYKKHPNYKFEYLHDQYNRVHQDVIDRLTGPKSGRKKNKKSTNPVKSIISTKSIKTTETRTKTARGNDKSVSIVDQFNEEVMNQNKADYLEDISSMMEYQYVLLDPGEPLVLDEGIMKFHPGFSINYVSRWAQVTKTVLRFYKNCYHSVCSFRKPLLAIPMQYIKDVKKCKIKPKRSNARKVYDKNGKNTYDMNQFEILLKEDYEAIYNLNKKQKEYEDLKLEYELVRRLNFQNRLTKKYKEYRQRCREERQSKYSININSKNRRENSDMSIRTMHQFERDEINKLSRSHPRINSHSVLFDHDSVRSIWRLNKSQEQLHTVNNISNNSVLSRGRQKEYLASGDRSVISIDEQFIHSSCSKGRTRNRTHARLMSRKGKSTKRDVTPFDSTQIVDGHLMPIRVNKAARYEKLSLR